MQRCSHFWPFACASTFWAPDRNLYGHQSPVGPLAVRLANSKRYHCHRRRRSSINSTSQIATVQFRLDARARQAQAGCSREPMIIIDFQHAHWGHAGEIRDDRNESGRKTIGHSSRRDSAARRASVLVIDERPTRAGSWRPPKSILRPNLAAKPASSRPRSIGRLAGDKMCWNRWLVAAGFSGGTTTD
jgi:hypothetical protein